jgi:hypothetical protein
MLDYKWKVKISLNEAVEGTDVLGNKAEYVN